MRREGQGHGWGPWAGHGMYGRCYRGTLQRLRLAAMGSRVFDLPATAASSPKASRRRGFGGRSPLKTREAGDHGLLDKFLQGQRIAAGAFWALVSFVLWGQVMAAMIPAIQQGVPANVLGEKAGSFMAENSAEDARALLHHQTLQTIGASGAQAPCKAACAQGFSELRNSDEIQGLTEISRALVTLSLSGVISGSEP